MYAHDEFNLLHIEGIGNVDGEEIERFWSFLGPFGTFVKEMTAANRKDFLSNRVGPWNGTTLVA